MQIKSNKALLIGTVLGAAIIVLLVLVLMKQNHLITQRSEQHDAMLSSQKTLIEAKRRSSLMPLMRSLLDQANAEVETNPSRSLSDKLIKQLAILSDSFAPEDYNYIENDSLHAVDLVQERGQLLLFLLSMDLDPGSFDQIKQKVSFARADLEGADLEGYDLSGIDLTGAYLKRADLTGANLNTAVLKGANLWGADLINANLEEAALNRADMRWVVADSAHFQLADLSGANLEGSMLRESNLAGCTANYAFFNHAIFKASDLSGINLFMTELQHANFIGAKLRKANLSESNLSHAVFDSADLSDIILRNNGVSEENWFEVLDSWQATGRENIKENYKVIKAKSGNAPFSIVIKK